MITVLHERRMDVIFYEEECMPNSLDKNADYILWIRIVAGQKG
jgi:hypothetical protein